MTDWIVQLIEGGGYWAIALLMCLENVFPPIPSEVIMTLGGIEAGQGQLNFWGVIASGTIGSVAGNYFWLMVGRRIGLSGMQHFVARWGRWLTLNTDDVDRLNRFFHRHGSATIFFARMLPNVRTLISLPAGLFEMPRWKFLVWTAAGTSVWNIAIGGIGYQLGSRIEEIDAITGPLSVAIIAVIVIVYVWRWLGWKSGSGNG
ncbi:MAG: DedA family protein [Blastomonas sp.]